MQMLERRHIHGSLVAIALMAAGAAVVDAEAAFKAKEYPECYAPLETAREQVPPPPTDYAGKAKAIGNMAGAVGRIGGFGGLGGALGGLGAAAGTANQVATYSSWIADAAEFGQMMRTDYPELDGRFGAYGEKINADANDLRQAGKAALASQNCYAEAYDALVVDIESGAVKRRQRNRRYKEITEGLDVKSELLIDARNRMNTNIRAYNDGLVADTGAAGLNLGDLVGVAASSGLASQALSSLGNEVADATCDPFDGACACRQAAYRAQAAGGWGGLYASSDAMAVIAPSYGIAQDVALQAALYSGNGAAAVGALGAAGAATQAWSSYTALTSAQREQPICAGIDDGSTLFACLVNDGVVPDAPSIEGFILDDLSTLGLLTSAGGADAAAGALAAAAGAAVEEAALSKLLRAGEVSGEYLAVNRGLNAADRSQATISARTGERPW